MKIKFLRIDDNLLWGVSELKNELNIELSDGGIPVIAEKCGEGISIVKNGDGIKITYGKNNEFFRALSQIKYVLESGNEVKEKTFTTDLCFMADVSRNAVLNMASAKRMIRYMALMGYDSFMLYTEDTFELEGYPYFGHMRGRYSKEELREIDDYAYGFGIEVIPCIQTLAHLSVALRWREMYEVTDTPDILLVGAEKTYEFIDAMLRTCKECFRSKRINIGMDEAAQLGLGRYVRKNGYKDQHEIMLEHLNKVVKMCHDMDYHPMMWSDMFFRMVIPNGGYYSSEVEIPQNIIDLVPDGLTIIYWDYYDNSEELFGHMVDSHLKFNNPIAFAGGAWKWSGFAPDNRFSVRVTEMQMKVCREKGLNSVIVTCWGDDGAEAAQFSALASILYFAEAAYAELPDNDSLNRRALECLGISYDDLLVLDCVNDMPGVDAKKMINPSKYLMYNDPLGGIFDFHLVEGVTGKTFGENAAKLEELTSHALHGYLYDTMAKLCRVLELKAELSVNIRNAYKANDREELKKIAEKIIPECIARLDAFIEAFRHQWYLENKTFVFANHETRLGGQRERLKSTALRLASYIAGEIEKIEELEQPVIPYVAVAEDSSRYPYLLHNLWSNSATVGVM